jgi:V/A-type H+/Na+-transporting ATPase subunit C
MQAGMTTSGTDAAIAFKRHIAKDLDYLAARLHGRRSRMAEGERLEGLCRIGSLQEFFSVLFPGFELTTALEFQSLCIRELVRELSGFHAYMSGPGTDLLDWALVRFQVENLKVLIRAWFTKVPIEEPDRHLVSLPAELTLDAQGLTVAESLKDFVRLVPEGILQENLVRALKVFPDYPRPFLFEAALDRGYFEGLLVRMENLPRKDREIVRPMVYQEVDMFHLMLVARGRFYYGLTPDILRPLCVGGTLVSRAILVAMLNDSDLATAAGRVVGRVLDAAPFEGGSGEGSAGVDAAAAEGLAWNRFLRLSNLAFRGSHMGLGAIIGYVGLRRVEVANLITICEGIRNGMAADRIRGRLIPRTDIVQSRV